MINNESLRLHKELCGKIEITSKVKFDERTLPLLYTPHVADVCREIKKDFTSSFKYTWRRNTIAIVSDGSATLGLGDMGLGVLPVLEGKAVIFKQMAGVNAVPIYVSNLYSRTIDLLRDTIIAISGSFGAICLEDIASPGCFTLEKMLRETLNIPVVHNDQHMTSIAILSALFKSLEIVDKNIEDIKIVISGAGAGGTAITKLLLYNNACGNEIGDIVVLDSKGIIDRKRKYTHDNKNFISCNTNKHNISGGLEDAIKNTDVFIGLSTADVFKPEYIGMMNNDGKDSIIFALANPVPEINPILSYEHGAYIVCTGRSDYPNQINNALIFPGVFKGLLDNNVRLDDELKTLIAKEMMLLTDKKHPVITHIFDERLVDMIYNVVVNYKRYRNR